MKEQFTEKCPYGKEVRRCCCCCCCCRCCEFGAREKKTSEPKVKTEVKAIQTKATETKTKTETKAKKEVKAKKVTKTKDIKASETKPVAPKATEAKVIEIKTTSKPIVTTSTETRMESLSQRLNALRSESATVTQVESVAVKLEPIKTIKQEKIISTQISSKTVTRSTKYDETEVRSALAGLLSSMKSAQSSE